MKVIEDDVAIIGMAGSFAQSPDVDAYWDNILQARCCITDHPAASARDYLAPDADEFGRVYTVRGGFLGDIAHFNPLDYGVMPDAMEGCNADQFLILKAASDALDDAGLGDDFPRERTDVIIGHGMFVSPGYSNVVQHGLILDQMVGLIRQMNPHATPGDLADYRERLRLSLPAVTASTLPSIIPNIIAGRIANRLNLMGANYIVDAACASSLIALNHGWKNLLLGHCDIALVGGVQGCISIQDMMVFCSLGALSHQAAPRPFDQSADGTLLSEGLGAVVLKRRKDAERDGNRIYAIVKGVGIASDGKSQALLAPRLDGEALAMERAYEMAEVNPDSVELIEAHGTGIPLGDATEVQAMTRVFGSRNGGGPRCALGSVKSMIGHCVPASGMASLIKTTLALHHKILPPMANFEAPPAEMNLDQTPFYISTEARPWIHHRAAPPRRAGINTLGFGGINAHCVLEEYT